MDFTGHTDQELTNIRSSMPKHTNDCTPEQMAIDKAVYAEQIRRYRAEAADYNQRATEVTGLKHGDAVEATFQGAFMSLDSYTGKVVYNRGGRLCVKTDRADDTGRKQTPISKAWKLRERS